MFNHLCVHFSLASLPLCAGSISELVARYVANQGLGPKSLYKLQPEGEGQGQSQDQDASVLSQEDEQAVQSMSRLERLQCRSTLLGAPLAVMFLSSSTP